MPKVSYFLYSAEVDIVESNLVITTPRWVLTPLSIPGEYSFVVTIALTDTPRRSNGDVYKLKLEFAGPVEREPKDVIIASDEIEIDPPESWLPPELQGGVVNFDFRGFEFEEAGTYVSKVYLDGVLLGEYPISVIERSRL